MAPIGVLTHLHRWIRWGHLDADAHALRQTVMFAALGA